MKQDTWRCPVCGFAWRVDAGEPWSFIGFYDDESDAAPELLQSCPRCLFAALRKLAPDLARVEETNG